MEKIERCPFCHSTNVFLAWLIRIPGRRWIWQRLYQVRCGYCRADGGGYDAKEAAIGDWNSCSRREQFCKAKEADGD